MVFTRYKRRKSFFSNGGFLSTLSRKELVSFLGGTREIIFSLFSMRALISSFENSETNLPTKKKKIITMACTEVGDS